MEYSLLPSIEFIYDIFYNNETWVLMIAKSLFETRRMDLKSVNTFEHLSSLELNIDFRYHAFRYC